MSLNIDLTESGEKGHKMSHSGTHGKARSLILAVDGPAGSGKSHICGEISRRLNWTYVNTGFLYRAVALLSSRAEVSFEDEEQLASIANKMCASLNWNPVKGLVIIDGEDVTELLTRDHIGQGASRVAKKQGVRTALLPLQRRLALESPHGAVVDGRDIGTVIFPDADLKIFLTASIDARAHRRLLQLEGKGYSDEAFHEMCESIKQRDLQDSQRGIAPLVQAEDAILIDSSNLSIDQVLAKILHLLEPIQAAQIEPKA